MLNLNATRVKQKKQSMHKYNLYTAIGKTVQLEGLVDDGIVKASPMAGMGRGGALTG